MFFNVRVPDVNNSEYIQTEMQWIIEAIFFFKCNREGAEPRHFFGDSDVRCSHSLAVIEILVSLNLFRRSQFFEIFGGIECRLWLFWINKTCEQWFHKYVSLSLSTRISYKIRLCVRVLVLYYNTTVPQDIINNMSVFRKLRLIDNEAFLSLGWVGV